MQLRDVILIITMCSVGIASAQSLSLDSCRAMALRNNKQILISNKRVTSAEFQQQAALAAYFPAIDFTGGYMYNQKELSIFDSDQLLPTKTFDVSTGKYEFNLVSNPSTGEPIKGPNGEYIPSTVALIPKESMTYDIHNVFFGAITLTQPIFMGGKIIAMNQITHFAKDMAIAMRNSEAEKVIIAVDAGYWQIISLTAKVELARSYVALLDTLQRNVGAMIIEGVTTQSDLLSVKVKYNQAQIDLLKIENGVTLSRMALAQMCGLSLDTNITLADEEYDDILFLSPTQDYNIAEVYARRQDLKVLELGVKISEQESRVALSSMLPNIALLGSYSFSNPNMFNGFKNRFNGAFSVGVSITIPLWHWGGDYNKYRVAKAEETIMRLRVADAEEHIELQVSQACFKYQEAIKTYLMSIENLESANENLRHAQTGFKEGIMTIDNVMEAQTAWFQANSERIDAMIDVRLCDTYLNKALGTLVY